jgi:hypothetical protein
MASFQSKLARLPALPGLPGAVPPSGSGSGSLRGPAAGPACSPRPSLDDLRDRIARIVARGPAPAPRANPAESALPFAVEHTEHGPLYVRRVRVAPAARVGRIPLVAARDADPAMLALLALDPSLHAIDLRGALYVDTETTGLAGGTGTVPFLLGLSWFDRESGTFMVEQALLRRLGEEAPILALFTARLATATLIVTYNGKSFDLPLLRTRYVMNRMAAPAEPPHLDLVHVARRIHRDRLKARTLVAIEQEILGRARIDDVAGGDIVATYAHFLRTGDDEALLGVVEHNEADVLSMVALVGLYGESLGRLLDEGEGAGLYAPPSLDGADLAGVARTLRQAGALDRAAQLAEVAVARGGGARAVRARGDIARARGDKVRALADYETLAAEVDDPAVRLTLAKLYEHHVGAFELALAVVERGTGEDDAALVKRKVRLERKRARSVRTAVLPGIEDAASPLRRKRAR